MKKVFFGFLVLNIMPLFAVSYAQINQQVSFYYGNLGSELARNEKLSGGASFESKPVNVFGFNYGITVCKNLRLDLGLNQSSVDVVIGPEFMGMPVTARTENLKLVSIPILLHLTFVEYLFVNGGFLLDFQKSSNSFDSQSGLGLSLGMGATYKIQQFSIFVNPVFRKHAVIPSNPERFQQRLYELGILFGMGYSF